MHRRLIGVILWTTEAFGRRVLTGVIDHFRSDPTVDVLTLDAAADARQAARVLAHTDGTIVALNPQALHTWRTRIDSPMVAVTRAGAVSGISQVRFDDIRIGRRAARYLLRLRLPRLVFTADPHEGDLRAMAAVFADTARQAGVTVLPPPRLPHTLGTRCDRWLASLPAQTGIFACDDRWARRLTQRIIAHHRRVPDDLPILGLGNAPIVCGTGRPTLSSIDLAPERAGRAAGALLAHLLAGSSPAITPLAPLGVITRASTDTIAITDEAVATAVRHLRAHVLDPPSTPQLAAHVGLARRTLDARFRLAMGHSIHEEIISGRLSWAKHELTKGALSNAEIAARLGMHPANFSRFFNHHAGMSPSAWRCSEAPRLRGPTATHVSPLNSYRS